MNLWISFVSEIEIIILKNIREDWEYRIGRDAAVPGADGRCDV